jgi:phospholipase A1
MRPAGVAASPFLPVPPAPVPRPRRVAAVANMARHGLLGAALLLATLAAAQDGLTVPARDGLAVPEAPPRRLPIELYKPIYVLTAWDFIPHDDRDSREVKFQISFRVPVWRFPGERPTHGIDAGGMYFGYSQKSFVQAFDVARSRPFRESNYTPELFLVAPDWQFGSDAHVSLKATPIEHESNGQSVTGSRSWNRSSVEARVLLLRPGRLLLGYKYWWRWPQGARATPERPYGDENPDIEHYLGRSELTAALPFDAFADLRAPLKASLLLRNGWKRDTFTYELNFDLRLPWGEGLYVRLNAFDGYGESLIDYNVRVRKVGLGLMLE